MTILDRIEASMAHFRPRNPKEFVALQLARRFDDLYNLPKYLAAAQRQSKDSLLDAANAARMRHQLNRAPLSQLFFEVIAERDGEEPRL